MNYRLLGNTGLTVSEIGFGCWGIGGNKKGAVAYGPADDQQSLRALRTALDQGITFYDTADIYGFGHSETILGKAFSSCRSRVQIASKSGMFNAAGQQDFSADHLQNSLEGTLRRLGADYVDVYQLHNPPPMELGLKDALFNVMVKMQQQGKIRAIGVSLQHPNDGVAFICDYGLKCLQVNFNLVDQRPVENGLFDLCLRRNVGIIVRTPLTFGMLTGAFTGKESFSPHDHRRRWPPAQLAAWAGALKLFKRIMNHEPDQTPAQFALRFCLSYPAVSTVIPGMMKESEVLENTKASLLGPLNDRECSELSAIYKQFKFFRKS